MTWLAELKPNTALNHRGVVDGSRERKGARRQRFLIQINTEPRFSSKPLLSNIDSQWLFQHSLGKRLQQIHVLFFLHTKHFPYSALLSGSGFLLFIYSPRISPFWSHLFTDSLPLLNLLWSPGSSFLVAQKTSVTDCLPPVCLWISCVITLS